MIKRVLLTLLPVIFILALTTTDLKSTLPRHLIDVDPAIFQGTGYAQQRLSRKTLLEALRHYERALERQDESVWGTAVVSPDKSSTGQSSTGQSSTGQSSTGERGERPSVGGLRIGESVLATAAGDYGAVAEGLSSEEKYTIILSGSGASGPQERSGYEQQWAQILGSVLDQPLSLPDLKAVWLKLVLTTHKDGPWNPKGRSPGAWSPRPSNSSFRDWDGRGAYGPGMAPGLAVGPASGVSWLFWSNYLNWEADVWMERQLGKTVNGVVLCGCVAYLLAAILTGMVPMPTTWSEPYPVQHEHVAVVIGRHVFNRQPPIPQSAPPAVPSTPPTAVPPPDHPDSHQERDQECDQECDQAGGQEQGGGQAPGRDRDTDPESDRDARGSCAITIADDPLVTEILEGHGALPGLSAVRRHPPANWEQKPNLPAQAAPSATWLSCLSNTFSPFYPTKVARLAKTGEAEGTEDPDVSSDGRPGDRRIGDGRSGDHTLPISSGRNRAGNSWLNHLPESDSSYGGHEGCSDDSSGSFATRGKSFVDHRRRSAPCRSVELRGQRGSDDRSCTELSSSETASARSEPAGSQPSVRWSKAEVMASLSSNPRHENPRHENPRQDSSENGVTRHHGSEQSSSWADKSKELLRSAQSRVAATGMGALAAVGSIMNRCGPRDEEPGCNPDMSPLSYLSSFGEGLQNRLFNQQGDHQQGDHQQGDHRQGVSQEGSRTAGGPSGGDDSRLLADLCAQDQDQDQGRDQDQDRNRGQDRVPEQLDPGWDLKGVGSQTSTTRVRRMKRRAAKRPTPRLQSSPILIPAPSPRFGPRYLLGRPDGRLSPGRRRLFARLGILNPTPTLESLAAPPSGRLHSDELTPELLRPDRFLPDRLRPRQKGARSQSAGLQGEGRIRTALRALGLSPGHSESDDAHHPTDLLAPNSGTDSVGGHGSARKPDSAGVRGSRLVANCRARREPFLVSPMYANTNALIERFARSTRPGSGLDLGLDP
ncbi:putative transmembrane protein [Gregarina niphandrodes]|uniref:Transmembrane protein n=1 Tax=Gregarina niphandrodes TaxID=110365 RepID=A0A023B050_GRENI|nr:putative transmembrane protein [Gregarina niphandrodes]EZG44923.1 putative transmembrane protein [Gregarina niphandrodes]|eukprot:XP_011132622.1 putative transmembrane protein [Gregarina niphandrodes]